MVRKSRLGTGRQKTVSAYGQKNHQEAGKYRHRLRSENRGINAGTDMGQSKTTAPGLQRVGSRKLPTENCAKQRKDTWSKKRRRRRATPLMSLLKLRCMGGEKNMVFSLAQAMAWRTSCKDRKRKSSERSGILQIRKNQV